MTSPANPVVLSAVIPATGPRGLTGPQGDPGPVAPSSEPRPSDVGVIAWSGNPQRIPGLYGYSTGSVGKLLLMMFMSGKGGSVSNMSYYVTAAGAGLANCYLGIYDMAGNLVGGSSPDQSANMMTAGAAFTARLATPAVLNPGAAYRVGLVIGAATTGPTFGGYAANSPGFTNMGIATGKQLCGQVGSGYTALPSTYSPNTVGNVGGGIVFVMT